MMADRSKDAALEAVAQDGLALRGMSLHLSANKEVVLAAVAQDGEALGN